MAEAAATLQLVSAIVQLVSFSAEVVNRLNNFRSLTNDAPAVFYDISVQIPLLISDLKKTEEQATRGELDREAIKAVLAVVNGCHSHIKTLNEILDRTLPSANDSAWRTGKKVILSFRHEEKARLIAGKLRHNVVYLTHHSVVGKNRRQEVSSRIGLQEEEQLKALDWLSSDDPSVNHNRAIEKRQPDTGTWFLESEEFRRWRTSPKSLAWLYGITGCGKTILCSTTIEALHSLSGPPTSAAVAYFYFDYNNASSVNVGNMLRSVIKQLCVNVEELPHTVRSFCSKHRASGQQPSNKSLLTTLNSVFDICRKETFIVLDALDEYPEAKRHELLNAIKLMMQQDFKEVHILATSRPEQDIHSVLGSIATEKVDIQSSLVDADIKLHISACLSEDHRLSRLPLAVKEDIERRLGSGAQGMFRWAVCQLDILRNCSKVSTIRRALEELPSTLDETYERVLTGIDQSDVQEAQSMLQWLALAQRPLTIQEVAETAVVKVEGAPVDSEDRFYDPYDAIRICRSLVATTEETLRICGKLVRCQVVRFAHFSVKEYLLSERISQGPAASFAIDPAVSQSQIGQCCLSVLLQNDKRIDQLPDSGNMPLLYYAAEYWFTYFRHYKAITSHADPFTSLVIKFFAESPMAFQNWLSAYDVNIRWGSVRFSGWRVRFGPSPLYYACLLGLEELVKILLNQGVDANAFGGKYGNALVAASMQGSELTVRYLLQHKADVHGPGGWVFGNALQASSYFGHEHIVKILLENGAMPDARRDEDDSALQHACESGHESIVRLLLDAGSDVNTRAGGYGYALTAAAERGHKSIVALLLDHGANANNQGGIYGNALQAAAGGHAATTEAYESIILSLLNAGANINAQGGGFGDALRAACTRQHASIMKLLLRRGAKIDPIVQKLLDAEEATVNTNAPANSDIAYALQAAYSDRDEEQIISLLVSATLRLIHIRHESLRAHRSRQPKPNLVRLRKVVRYALKSETDRYWSEHLEKS